MNEPTSATDQERGYLPGHIYKVIRGPYVGQIGQWDCVVAHGVIGLTWPGLGRSAFGDMEHIFFRLEDLEDISDRLV